MVLNQKRSSTWSGVSDESSVLIGCAQGVLCACQASPSFLPAHSLLQRHRESEGAVIVNAKGDLFQTAPACHYGTEAHKGAVELLPVTRGVQSSCIEVCFGVMPIKPLRVQKNSLWQVKIG